MNNMSLERSQIKRRAKVCASYRPAYHFTTQQGFLNDPNGLIYFEGVFHLFFQFNPVVLHPGVARPYDLCYWGHAVSSDLIHFEELEPVRFQHNGHAAFSGSAVVDWHNSSGLQKSSQPPLVAAYTSWGEGQCLAFSSDGGFGWEGYKNNPVLTLPGDEKKTFLHSARDPKIFYDEAREKWIMIIYQNRDQKEDKGFSFFSSKNLKEWQFESHLSGFYVCPDLFQLPVEGESGTKWVLLDWKQYAIGNFDGKKFTPESEMNPLDWGKSFSASQTWNNISKADGRRIQIAWLNSESDDNFPDLPYSQQLSFPCELGLRRDGEKIRLCRNPIMELEKVKKTLRKEKSRMLHLTQNLLEGLNSYSFNLTFCLDLSGMTRIEFKIRDEIFSYDKSTQKAVFMGKTAPLKLLDEKLEFNFLFDRSSVELFLNHGIVVFSNAIKITSPIANLFFTNLDGVQAVEIKNLVIASI